MRVPANRYSVWRWTPATTRRSMRRDRLGRQAISSMLCLALFLRVWKPKRIWTDATGKKDSPEAAHLAAPADSISRRDLVRAWTPLLILSVLVVLWGVPQWPSSSAYFFKYLAGTSPASTRARMQICERPLRLLSKQLLS